jgi:hypothetical protein
MADNDIDAKEAARQRRAFIDLHQYAGDWRAAASTSLLEPIIVSREK